LTPKPPTHSFEAQVAGKTLMKPETRDQLKAAFDRFDSVESQEAYANSRRADEKAAAIADFDRVRREMIRPIMEAIGAFVASRGHQFEIITTEDREKRRTTTITYPSIAFYVRRGGAQPSILDPYLSFDFNHTGPSVSINKEGHGLGSGYHDLPTRLGHHRLPNLSKDIIERSLSLFVQSAFGK
jgi:hypothetical protein